MISTWISSYPKIRLDSIIFNGILQVLTVFYRNKLHINLNETYGSDRYIVVVAGIMIMIINKFKYVQNLRTYKHIDIWSLCSYKAIVDYIDSQFEAYLQEELKVKRSIHTYHDSRIHACLYFIAPTGHS